MKKLITITAAILLTILVIDFVRFPEWYMPTWKYQLKNDINKGDEVAIEYYERNYVANDRILFEGEN